MCSEYRQGEPHETRREPRVWRVILACPEEWRASRVREDSNGLPCWCLQRAPEEPQCEPRETACERAARCLQRSPRSVSGCERVVGAPADGGRSHESERVAVETDPEVERAIDAMPKAKALLDSAHKIVVQRMQPERTLAR